MDEALIKEIMECQVRRWLAKKRRAAWKPPPPVLSRDEKRRICARKQREQAKLDRAFRETWGKV